MNSRYLRFSLIFLTATALSVACTKKKDEDNGYNFLIPKVTDPVGIARNSKVGSSSAGLYLKSYTNWSNCVSAGNCNSSAAQQAFSMGSTFVSIGIMSDLYACMAQAFVNGGDVAADGSPTVFVDSSGFKIKMTATASGSTLTSYSIRVCDNGATQNAQYTSGTVAADGTTAIRTKIDENRMATGATNYKFSFDLTGNFLDGIWHNKQLTIEASTPPSLMKTVITQGTDTLLIEGAGDVSGTTYQIYGKFKLLGSSSNDYAFDEGSALLPGQGISSWNSNGNAGGSAYATDVQNGNAYPVPTSFGGSFSADPNSDENWNCQTGSDRALLFSETSDKANQAMAACFSAFSP